MLEKLVEGNRIGDFILDLHPSANELFSEESHLASGCIDLKEDFKDYIDNKLIEKPQNNKEKARNIALQTAKHSGITLGTGLYLAAETTSRLSESAVRGTGRLLAKAGNLAYDKVDFVKDLTEKVKEGYKSIVKKISRPKKKKLGRLYERIKNPLVVGLSVAAIALGYGGIKSCGDEPEPTPIVAPDPRPTPEPEDEELYVPDPRPEPTPRPQPRPAPEQTRDQTASPLNQFSNERVLAYCANQMEKDYVIETLRDHNNSVRSININDNETEATIVNAHGNEVYVDIVVEGENIPGDNYDIITLRGHVQDMLPLQRETVSHEADNTLYILGGCRSAQFIDDLAEPNRAVIASTTTGYGPMNTYLLLRVIDEMDNNNTWQEMNRDLRANSQRVRNEFVLPDTAAYNRRL